MTKIIYTVSILKFANPSNLTEMPSGAPEPPLFTKRFQEVTVPQNGTFELVAKVTGNPVPEVSWLR